MPISRSPHAQLIQWPANLMSLIPRFDTFRKLFKIDV